MPYLLSLTQATESEKINHLRALAAFWIFVFHYYQFIAHSFFTPLKSLNPFLLLVYHGYFFVYLFFILSGFLLAKTYTKQLNLKSFFSKRFIRIFPAYYLCLAVYYLVFSTGIPSSKVLGFVFSHNIAVYPNPLRHLWFINRLLECYLCFPILWWITQKMGRLSLLLIYLLCLLASGYWVMHYQITLLDHYFSLILCLSHFILGILVAGGRFHSKHLYAAVVISLIFFFGILLWLHQEIWRAPLAHTWISMIWLNFIALFFAIIIKTYLSSTISLPYILSKILQKLGNISYSFYLYHYLVLVIFVIHREYLTAYASINFIGLFLLCIIAALFFQTLLNIGTRTLSAIWSKREYT